MNKFKRILGALLILLALALVVMQVGRTRSDAGKNSQAGAGLVADALRQALRSPIDSLFAQVDLFLQSKPDELKIFDVLKAAKDDGRVFGAFVESNTRTLMDPYDRETIPEGPLGSGFLTLSTGNYLALPPQDELDAIGAIEQEKVHDRLPVSNLLHYMNGEKDSPQIWAVRPFTTSADTTVKELGVGFNPLTEVWPYTARLLNERFPADPVWKAVPATGPNAYAAELVNPSGQTAFLIGDKTGKTLAKTIKLDRTDLGYVNWTINAWAPRPATGFVFYALALVMGILGLVLVRK